MTRSRTDRVRASSGSYPSSRNRAASVSACISIAVSSLLFRPKLRSNRRGGSLVRTSRATGDFEVLRIVLRAPTYASCMVRMRRVDLRLATQVLVLQVAVVTLTLGLAGGMLAF